MERSSPTHPLAHILLTNYMTCLGSRSPMKSIFGTPTASADNFAVDSDTEATPRAKLFKELKM